MSKQMYLFLTSFSHEQMLRIYPQYINRYWGKALVPLRSGLSANGLPKGRKTSADISNNAQTADL